VLFYGVVSFQTEKVVEFFLEREAAEAMIGEVRKDEPELTKELRFEAVATPVGTAAFRLHPALEKGAER
jgi:hypothetical protein